MHMPSIHPFIWIKSLGYVEDDHTCPWCGETFSVHFCENGPAFHAQQEDGTRESEKPEEQ
jgi:hypothetical protein